MLGALTSAVRALVFVLFLVLIPTVPITLAFTRVLHRARDGPSSGDVRTGRTSSSPFQLISIIASAIAVCVFVALLIVLAAQAIAGSDKGESVAPVENGGAGEPPSATTGTPVPHQGNATAGKQSF